MRYDTWFERLKPQNGLLTEEKVRNWLIESYTLPDSFLDQIWKLSDQDKDGFLDRCEFTVAFHLAVRAYYFGDEIPDQVCSQLYHHGCIFYQEILILPRSLGGKPLSCLGPGPK